MNSACVAAQLRCSNQFLLLLLPFLPPSLPFFLSFTCQPTLIYLSTYSSATFVLSLSLTTLFIYSTAIYCFCFTFSPPLSLPHLSLPSQSFIHWPQYPLLFHFLACVIILPTFSLSTSPLLFTTSILYSNANFSSRLLFY